MTNSYDAPVGFERLVEELSARLVDGSAGRLDEEIPAVQRRVCEALGLERSFVFEYSTWTRSMELLYVYQSRDELRPRRGGISEVEFPWVVSRLLQGETIVIGRLSDLPPEADVDRASLIRIGTTASVIAPFGIGGRLMGCMTFALMGGDRTWPAEMIDGLSGITRAMGQALRVKRAHEVERVGEVRMDLAATAAGAGFWELDSDTQRVSGNAVMFELHRLATADHVPLEDMLAAIHPDDAAEVRNGVRSAIDRSGDLAVEYRVLHRNDQIRWVRVRGQVVRPSPYEPPRLVGVAVDVTERRLSEEQLRTALAENQRLQSALKAENVFLRQEVERGVRMASITGESAAVRQVLQQAERVAVTGSTVLLLGETGTGKERFAAFIHGQSPRRDHLMVRVNCAAIPATLMESELFGREKGAYTGALSRQVGRFELAHGSTIFLDEIGDLPAEVQVKLLRVLQERQIERLGSPTPINVDVRIIAATHQNLEEAVQAGRFREDLYYRLNVFPIRIPPLRERRDDIAPLAREIIAELEKTMGRHFEYVSKASMESLTRYDWPGNVRELRNVLERAMILGSGPTLSVALPSAPAGPAAAAPVAGGDGIADVERQHILAVLKKTGWRVRGEAGAAKSLGLKPTTLEHRMVKLGITRPGKA
jgi:formate hydrogenlyase transcriptional activator